MKNIPLLKVKVSFHTEFVCEGSTDPMQHADVANNTFWTHLNEIVDQLDDPPVVTCQPIHSVDELPEGWDAGCNPWRARRSGKDKTIAEHFATNG
jgi:hypothetical protein